MTRVLVVEDDRPVRDLMADVLRDGGYDVESASDGEVALGRMGRHVPDVIVLDLMMPGMDGWGFVRTLRNLTRWGRIPIVVVSATGDLPTAAARLGVTEVVAKPFDLGDLLEAIERAQATSPRHA